MPSYAYNSSNALTTTSAATYTYDNNGNTLTKALPSGTTQYTWDFENRLASVVLPGSGGSVAFKYDPFGRRIQKAFTQGSSTTTTNYVYDGANSVEEVDQNGNILGRYTQGAGIDEELGELRSGASSYYEADGLGSITSLTGSAGAIANSYTYDTFGNLTVSGGTVTNPFQYTGRDYDPETGLRYYRARYYDSSVGRFLSEDPIGSLSSRPNFYLYGKNEPTFFRDPSGFQETPQQIFQDAENEALRRLKDPNCAAAFKGKGPCTIKATNYRRKPPKAIQVNGPWIADTLAPNLVYINQDSEFYNYVPGNIYQVVDPLAHTIYTMTPGAVENALTLLHELTHQLNLGVNDAPNGMIDHNAALANDLYVLRNCFSDLRVPLP